MTKSKKESAALRRKNKPKRRVVNERREEMLIITSATQSDIYAWAVSMAMMVGVIAIFIVLALVGV